MEEKRPKKEIRDFVPVMVLYKNVTKMDVSF
jgi:hypothetical protein